MSILDDNHSGDQGKAMSFSGAFTKAAMNDPADYGNGSNTGFFSCLFGLCSDASSSEPTEEHGESSEQKATDATTATVTEPPAQTPYVPNHAKDTFLKTATSRQMKKANEIL
ncbi:hypothetical protein F4804DRAFT_338077 [Jackrogersella minutella]|nr:hypothetical protein F4804DRAFT_338077 [Jackrogersella minutella]